MSKLIVPQEGVEITQRFFKAIEVMRLMKQIRGLQTFTRRYGLNRWNLVTVRDEPESHFLKPELLAYIVRDYGVSAEWLLLGKGEIFGKPLADIMCERAKSAQSRGRCRNGAASPCDSRT